MSELLIEKLIEIGDNCQDDDWEWAKGYDDGIKAAINIVEEFFKESKLNPNQEIVVSDVKQDHENYGHSKFNAIHLAFTSYATGYYRALLKNDKEFYQVLSTLIAWALEQEEE